VRNISYNSHHTELNKHRKILFTATFTTSFIQNDLATLQKYFQVTSIISSGIKTVFRYRKALNQTDITFSWFASVYSSLLVWMAKRHKKRSIIVIGGVDVAKLPEVNYGIWNSRWKSTLVRYGLTHADAVISVDESLKNDAMRLAGYDGKNIHVIPTGYDPGIWIPSSIKQNFVLIVANCPDMIRVKIKGVDFFLAVARAMPDTDFTIIGLHHAVAKKLDIPANVTVHPFVTQPELLAIYQRAKVFFQPSFREGLPSTLCEAMLCECYPVGTNVGGIPTAIGETGSVVQYGNIEEACAAISAGLHQDRCEAARDRIATHFTHTQREEKLLALIESLTHEN